MLAHRFSRRLAKELFRPWGESRLLRFSGNAGDDQEAPKTEGQAPDSTRESSAEQIGAIAGRMRKRVEKLHPLVAKAAANSPIAIRQIANLLQNPVVVAKIRGLQGRDIDDIINALDRRHLVLTTRAQSSVNEENEVAGILQDMAVIPEVALAIARMFGERLETYDERSRTLRGASLTACALINQSLESEQITEWMNRKDSLTAQDEQQIDAALQSIGIRPASLAISKNDAKDMEKVLGKSPLNGDEYDSAGNAKPKRRLFALLHTLAEARRLTLMEGNDTGKQSTLETTDVVKEALEKENKHARAHLERIIRAYAEELAAGSQGLRKHLTDTYGNNEERAMREIGIAPRALNERLRQVELTFQHAQGTAKYKGENGTETDDPDNLPKPRDEKFLEKSGAMIGKLDELAPLGSTNIDTKMDFVLDECIRDRREAERWAERNAGRLARAVKAFEEDPLLTEEVQSLFQEQGISPEQIGIGREQIHELADVADRCIGGTPTPKDLNFLWDYCEYSARKRYDLMLLAVEQPFLIAKLREDRKNVREDRTENTPENRKAVQDNLEKTITTIFEGGIEGAPRLEALNHTTAITTEVSKHLRQRLRNITRELKLAGSVRPPNPFEYGTALIRECRQELAKINKAVRLLQEFHASSNQRITLLPAEAYARVSGSSTSGALYRNGIIYLNETVIRRNAQLKGVSFEQERDREIYHERGHALLDVLIRETALFPNLLSRTHAIMRQRVAGDPEGRTFHEMLLLRAEDWELDYYLKEFHKEEVQILQGQHAPYSDSEIQRIATRRAECRYRDVLVDEFINKYASWKHGGPDKGTPQEDLALFTAFEALPQVDGFGKCDERARKPVAMKSTQDLEALMGAEGGGHGGQAQGSKEPEKQGVELAKMIVDAQNKFLNINAFIDAHGRIPGVEEFTGWVRQWEKAFDERIKKPFYNPREHQTSEKVLKSNLDIMERDFFSEATKQMDAVKSAESDLSGVEGHGHHGFFHSLQLMSLKDVWQMLQKASEDLHRMWEHRGTVVQSSFGEALTKWIPTNEIWGLKYFGQLKYEYHRRLQEAELHEIGVWKEALKNLDAYELQQMLGTAKEKEQLRGIIELLIEKGRLDLNDERLWHTLIELSGMHDMPVIQCKQSDVLRDKWLQKMVTKIWSDKDKFFEWRQQNDGGFESGKKKFTNTVDQLSNVKNGLSNTLRRQLELWVRCKETGEDVPDEVNPHLYEEILHYAMRNGKMTMEDKLFYLVQGIRHQLLSIDRLRIMAGQTGEILNLFPFIDYFYGHNNSLPEVTALGTRLEESSENKFKPGPKTTLWLHLELLRDQGAQERMSKAMSGARTEKLDHEDFPALVSQMGYAEVNEITGVLSGSRYKMSYEAAKNTYTGFGTKFKVLANLAELAAEGKATFTEQDAAEAAKSIAAYIQMDNILTNNARDENRITLSFDQLQQKAVSSGKGLVVADYRNGNQGFVKELVDTLPIEWGEVGKKLEGFNRNDFVRAVGDTTVVTDKERQVANLRAMPDFAREVKNAILRDPTILVNLLRKHRNLFFEENFGDKNEPEKYINTNVMETYLHDRARHEQLGGMKVAHH